MSAEDIKGRGDVAFKAKDYAEAVRLYTDAIDLDGSQAKYYSNRAAALMALRDYPRALDDADSAVRCDAAFAKGHARRGEALEGLERFSEAADAYREAARVDPSKPAYNTKHEAAQRRAVAAHAASSEGVVAFVSSRPDQVFQFVLRLFMIYSAIQYAIPVWGKAASAVGWRRLCMAAIVNLIITLKNEVGFPQFKMEYVARLLHNVAGQYLFFAIVMFGSRRPYFFALPVFLLSEIAHVFWFGSQLLRRASPSVLRIVQGQVDKVLPLVLKFHNSIPEAVVHYSTIAEVVLGLTMLVEMITPNRNPFTLVFYWQYLQMRYLLDQSGGIQKAFRLVDARFLKLTQHQYCPSIVARAYMWVRNALAKAAERPEPGQQPTGMAATAANMMQRCVIS
uniref:Uncharacterized protein n=1 Tax=Phaeomonas parva TaxID=124430 RepID=A0A7S1U794_9STRA|mmetsp:Transcript_3238/g.9408  ORF Transcript_3238/g.9408 Transcript_3238/m.9408 type:complete len:394 (+) Transcript_3238:56-1237(+)